jgi:hypothetical protein
LLDSKTHFLAKLTTSICHTGMSRKFGSARIHPGGAATNSFGKTTLPISPLLGRIYLSGSAVSQ